MGESTFLRQRVYELVGIILLAAGIFLVLAMASFQMEDIPDLVFPPQRPAGNLCGVIGAYVAYGIFQSVGWAGIVVPALLFLWGVSIFRERLVSAPQVQLAGAVILIGSLACLIELAGAFLPEAWFPAGGWAGHFIVAHIRPFLGVAGSVLVFWWKLSGRRFLR